MRELAVQSASGTYTDTDRDALNLEFGALMDEITRIAQNTEWNGQAVLRGNVAVTAENNGSTNDVVETHTIQLGSSSGQTMALTINTWVPTTTADNSESVVNAALTTDGAADAYGTAALYANAGDADTVASKRIGIDTVAEAGIAITNLDLAINGAAAERAKYGSYMARLQHASDNLANIATNTSASLSQIADADYAVETTELARTQIISQASTAMLAQANQVKQTVLALLQ